MSYIYEKGIFMVFKNDDLSKAILARFSVVSKWNVVFISLYLNTVQDVM